VYVAQVAPLYAHAGRAEADRRARAASVHVSRILVKLSARNRGEAAATAHRLGLT
jgi:DNA-binding NarL/FixJ family response regulator